MLAAPTKRAQMSALFVGGNARRHKICDSELKEVQFRAIQIASRKIQTNENGDAAPTK